MSVGTVIGSGLNFMIIGVVAGILGYAMHLMQSAGAFSNLLLSYDCLTFIGQMVTGLYISCFLFLIASIINMMIVAKNEAATGQA